MELQELIDLKKAVLKGYEKQTQRYNRLHQTYAKRYESMCKLCNEMIRDIHNLEAKLQQQKTNP